MKIYTKILIGMAVGVGVGALAGPNSVVAPKNTVHRIRRLSPAFSSIGLVGFI